MVKPRYRVVAIIFLATLAMAMAISTASATTGITYYNLDNWAIQRSEKDDVTIDYANYTVNVDWTSVIPTNATGDHDYWFHIENASATGWLIKLTLTNTTHNDITIYPQSEGVTGGASLTQEDINCTAFTASYDGTTFSFWAGTTKIFQNVPTGGALHLERFGYHTDDANVYEGVPSDFTGTFRVTVSLYSANTNFLTGGIIGMLIAVAIVGLLAKKVS